MGSLSASFIAESWISLVEIEVARYQQKRNRLATGAVGQFEDLIPQGDAIGCRQVVIAQEGAQ